MNKGVFASAVFLLAGLRWLYTISMCGTNWKVYATKEMHNLTGYATKEMV